MQRGAGYASINGNLIGSTTLTIAGCQTEGFLAGDSVLSDPGAAASGTISTVNNTTVVVTPSSASWANGQNLKRNPASYVAVTGSPITVSVAPFTTVNIPQANLAVSSTYYARVKYATTNVTAATSSFSAWSSFGTASVFTPAPGTAMNGGYFGGQINVSGTIYNLIVAPVATGQYGGSTPAFIQYKTVGSADLPSATFQNEVYGKPANDAGNDAAHPMFQWARALNIGGNTDWYIPAKNELEILYFNLKPNTTANNTSGTTGVNPNAVPARSSNYTAGTPAQTTATDFISGGTQAFATAFGYWSSTEWSSGAGSSTADAWVQSFSNGGGGYDNKDNSINPYYARAIRRVAA
jgi:hypothetical protein